MYVVQVVTLAIVLALMAYVFEKYRRGDVEWSDFLFWEVILIGLLLVSVFPIRLANEIRNILGLGRGLDALFVVAIGVAYLLIFRVYLAVDRTEREITELTRKVAIELEEMNRRLEEIEKRLR